VAYLHLVPCVARLETKKVLGRLLDLGSKGLGFIVSGLVLTNLWCRLVPLA